MGRVDVKLNLIYIVETIIDDINATRKIVTVTVPAESIRDKEQDIVNAFIKEAKVPGFRPGKAPASMVRTKYVKYIEAELWEKVVNDALNYVMENMGLDIYSLFNVEVEGKKVSTQKGAKIKVSLDITPAFELPEYKGIEVKIPAVKVTEEEIDEKIQFMRKQRAEYELTEEAAKKGDYVKVSYEGKIDGKPIAEILPEKPIYGTQKHTWEEAGAENVPGVSAVIGALVGMKAGDEKTVSMDFPADFKESEIAGKTASYHIAVEEVRNLILPEIDESFLKDYKVENLEGLRDWVKENLKKNKGHESEDEIRNQILKFLCNSTSFEIPESAIDEQADNVLRRLMMQTLRSGMMTEAQMEKSKNELIELSRKNAAEGAKANVILDKIGKIEKIELTNKDLQMTVMQEAYLSNMHPDEFMKELKQNRKLAMEIRKSTLLHKVLDFLKRQSKVEIESEAS